MAILVNAPPAWTEIRPRWRRLQVRFLGNVSPATASPPAASSPGSARRAGSGSSDLDVCFAERSLDDRVLAGNATVALS